MDWDWIIENEIGVGEGPCDLADIDILVESGFGARLDLTEPHENVYRESELLVYRNIPAPDMDEHGGAPLPENVLAESIGYAGHCLGEGNAIYVHCMWGTNRSPIVATAILCVHKNMRAYDAISLVKSRRPAAKPNFRQVAAMCGFLDSVNGR